MGVHGLWEIVGPTARPVRLESLAKKKLAVDASIWIYQFLKAVRDKEGNQLKNSHIVGFFRRICKLLYFGIQPVFVFDGGVPILKRQTIAKRKERREGNKETVKQTAQKILAQQLQRRAEQDIVTENSRNSPSKATKREIAPEDLEFTEYYEDNNYFDGSAAGKSPAKKTTTTTPKKKEGESKMFRRQDEYDLPELETFKIQKSDNRMITDYEYGRLTKDLQDEIQGIDLDRIDPHSAEFNKLPLSTQYIVLSHLRLRSRLRMGYSKDQLETLFSNSMDFSKFQIERVQKRNYLTQRLMNVTGMDSDNSDVIAGRIASEKDKVYSLQRTEGGWSLSIPAKGDDISNPINLDKAESIKDSDSDSDVQWEDVNETKTITKHPAHDTSPVKVFMDSSIHKKQDGLFVQNDEDESESDEDADFEDVDEQDEADGAIMARIKSLYDYAGKYNRKDNPISIHKPSDFGDIRGSEEEMAKKVEDEELKEAIERSKRDYLNLQEHESDPLNDSKALNTSDNTPIILSNDGLAKNKKSFKFDLSKSLLFNSKTTKKSSSSQDNKSAEAAFIENKVEKKSRPKPLPSWFNSTAEQINDKTHYTTGYTRNEPLKLTEDEKAGLYSYNDAENLEIVDSDDDVLLVSSDDDLIAVSNKPKAFRADEKRNNTNSLVADNDHVLISSSLDESEVELQDVEGIEPEKISNNKSPPQKKSIQDILQPQADTTTPVLPDYEFSENESEELDQNLEAEEEAYNSFVTNINNNRPTTEGTTGSFWSLDDEVKLQEQLKKQKRDSDEVNTLMILDVQDLLSRFGIPFITAPMEAEAQCAKLFQLGLVDGIITDDSDCFLFGGDKIYKNMFNEKNYVECYQSSDIESYLGITQQKFIELGIMLGSDYTEGLKGIGKVNAMEILAEFGSLENFEKWWIEYQSGKINPDSRQTSIQDKLRKKLNKSKFFINPNDIFTSNKIICEAYLNPKVDNDKTEFRWGYPNLDKLRTYLMLNVRWPQSKVDEILLPILKMLNKHGVNSQSTIEEFFPVETLQRRREIMMGKRLKDATEKLRGNSKRQKKS